MEEVTGRKGVPDHGQICENYCSILRAICLTGVRLEDLAIPSLAAEAAQRLEAAVDRGRALALDGHQVLSVVDQVVRPEILPAEVGSPGFPLPAAKGQEVPAVAIDGLGAQVLGHQAGEEGLPWVFARMGLGPLQGRPSTCRRTTG
jgi:hypothetical protein